MAGEPGYYGLFGAAWSLLVSELVMNLYVLPNSLRIAHDTLPGLLRGLLEVPPGLHPQALMRRPAARGVGSDAALAGYAMIT